jgi:hypothetical protein
VRRRRDEGEREVRAGGRAQVRRPRKSFQTGSRTTAFA